MGLGANGFKESTALKVNREIAKQFNKVCLIVGIIDLQNAGIKTEEKEKKKKDWWDDSKSSSSSDSDSDSDSYTGNVLSASDSDEGYVRRKKEHKKKDKRV